MMWLEGEKAPHASWLKGTENARNHGWLGRSSSWKKIGAPKNEQQDVQSARKSNFLRLCSCDVGWWYPLHHLLPKKGCGGSWKSPFGLSCAARTMTGPKKCFPPSEAWGATTGDYYYYLPSSSPFSRAGFLIKVMSQFFPFVFSPRISLLLFLIWRGAKSGAQFS